MVASCHFIIQSCVKTNKFHLKSRRCFSYVVKIHTLYYNSLKWTHKNSLVNKDLVAALTYTEQKHFVTNNFTTETIKNLFPAVNRFAA